MLISGIWVKNRKFQKRQKDFDMRHLQYPAQTGHYAVKVKSEQSYDNWHDFQTARLQISVGQDYHEGDKIIATLKWLNPRFSSVQICVNDSLQRFNMMFDSGLSAVDALEMSRDAGRDWLIRYGEIIKEQGNMEIVRWDDWLSRHDYYSVRQKIDRLYQSNDEFRALIVNNAEEIWERRKIKDSRKYCPDRHQEFLDISKEYLLEEIAVFSIMFEDRPAIDIYPGTALFAATVLQGRDLPHAPAGLGKGHFCRIDFSKKCQPANSDNLFPSQRRFTP